MNNSPDGRKPLPVGKLRSRISLLSPVQFDRLAVLVMSGGFNPVHLQHIRALEIARIAMERSGWTIIGGFLAPSSDQYLQMKANNMLLPLGRRIELCRFATQDSDWLDVCSVGEFSSYKACTSILDEVERESAALLLGHSVSGIEVMGSDATTRIVAKLFDEWAATNVGERQPWYQGRIICCIVRPGSDGTADAELMLRNSKIRSTEIGVRIILVDSAREGLSLEAVSSSEIRNFLERQDWDGLRARRWLHPKVFCALKTPRAFDAFAVD